AEPAACVDASELPVVNTCQACSSRPASALTKASKPPFVFVPGAKPVTSPSVAAITSFIWPCPAAFEANAPCRLAFVARSCSPSAAKSALSPPDWLLDAEAVCPEPKLAAASVGGDNPDGNKKLLFAAPPTPN